MKQINNGNTQLKTDRNASLIKKPRKLDPKSMLGQ